MFNSLLKRKKKPKNLSDKVTRVDGRELLLHHWHQILFAYILFNAIFVVISVLVLQRYTIGGDAADTPAPSSKTITSEEIEESVLPQRYKDLVKQRALVMPEIKDL